MFHLDIIVVSHRENMMKRNLKNNAYNGKNIKKWNEKYMYIVHTVTIININIYIHTYD